MNNSRWLRLYAETYRDPKINRLSDRLFRFWIECLCLASENNGRLPNHVDIGFHLRVGATTVLQNLISLKNAGLLDELPDKGFSPHNWDARQYKSDNESSSARVKRFRERSRNGDETFHGRFMKPHETVPEQKQKQKQIQKQNRTDTDTDTEADAREFAAAFPDQSDQNSTVREYISLVEPSEKEAVFACLERYKHSAVVARGAVQSGWKWLRAQKENGWRGEWDRAPPQKHSGSFLTEEESLRIIEEA